MLRNIDLEISKDHNSKNVPSVAGVLQGSFEIKLLAPTVFWKFLLLGQLFWSLFLQKAFSKMLWNIGFPTSKDHNSKNVSGVARVLPGSFGIKLLAPVVFVKFLLLDPPFQFTKRLVKSEITMTPLNVELLRVQFFSSSFVVFRYFWYGHSHKKRPTRCKTRVGVHFLSS